MERLNSWLAVLASLGVLVGIVVVVLELRQNTDAVRASTTVALEQNIANLMNSWTSSVEHSALLMRGTFTEQELTEDQRIFVNLLTRQLFLHMDSFYWAYRSGVLPDELWEREQRVLRGWVNSPGGRAVWDDGSGYSKPFQEYVESTLLE